MLNSNENRASIIAAFPNLASDPNFKIIDGCDPNYNCIALAGYRTDVWWWPRPEDQRPIKLDGVTYDWPFGIANNLKLETFIELFRNLQYEACDNGDYEEGFRKICLYGANPEKVTHAARQLTVGKEKGLWTSKLGQSFRILHSTPTGVSSVVYGNTLQYMKCKWP